MVASHWARLKVNVFRENKVNGALLVSLTMNLVGKMGFSYQEAQDLILLIKTTRDMQDQLPRYNPSAPAQNQPEPVPHQSPPKVNDNHKSSLRGFVKGAAVAAVGGSVSAVVGGAVRALIPGMSAEDGTAAE